MKAARRVGLEVLGWSLLLLGIAALILPGPGLLLLFAGMFVLAQQYEWAEKRLDPIEHRTLKAAADGVETTPRVVISGLGVLGLFAVAGLWVVGPPVPGWWPADLQLPSLPREARRSRRARARDRRGRRRPGLSVSRPA